MVRIPVFLVLTGVIFAAIMVGTEWLREHFDVAPIRILSGFAENNTLKPGEPLRVVLSVQRDRLCHTVVGRYVHSANGDVIVYRESLGGDAPIGVSRYAFNFPLPEGISPGKYTFKGVVASTCGLRRYVEITPALPFTVSP